MSKYDSLWKYITKNNKESYKLTFEETSKILGFNIDHSLLNYKKELKNYGYEIFKISMKEKIIIIKRSDVNE